MSIVKAQKEHIDFIADSQKLMAMESEGMELDHDLISRGVTEVIKDKSKGEYYIYLDGEKPVACLLTTFEWSDWRAKTVLWIQSVYVLKDYRRQGIYSKMYGYLKQIVNDNPSYAGIRLYVEKENTPAQLTYKKLGMDDSHYDLFEWLK